MRTLLWCLFFLFSCSTNKPSIVRLVDDIDAAAAVDAGVDATVIDAAPDARPLIDMNAEWTRTVITAGAATGIYRGADGTADDGAGGFVTAWEQGGITTDAKLVSGSWVTKVVATGMTGPEDAKAAWKHADGSITTADFDGDGNPDVVTCADAGKRCYVTFRTSTDVGNVNVQLAASTGHGYAMQADIADFDNDGLPDIAFGTRGGTPAVIAFLSNPGHAFARTGTAWIYHQVSEVGWTMSLVALDVDHDGDMDVVVSDRTRNGTSWALNGTRWEEQTSTGWLTHTISGGVCPPAFLVGGVCLDPHVSMPAGSCPVGQPMCATKNPGDEMFLTVAGDTVYDCSSSASNLDSRIMIHHTTDWLTWTHQVLPPAANVGHCQGIEVADVDGDGLQDIIVTTWKGNAYPVPAPDTNKSGVYWFRNLGGGVYQFGQISGVVGGKFDNGLFRTGKFVTSEQLDPNGGLGVVHYAPVFLP